MKPLIDSFTLLTVIPVPFVRRDDANGEASSIAPLFFPLVGALIGLVLAAVFALGDHFLPVTLAAALALTAVTALTGAIHVDGLADFADGVFGGRTAEDRLRIMKLPDVGAFGLAAVVIVILVDWTSISSLTGPDAWAALILTGLISRTAPLAVMFVSSYAPTKGLGQGYRGLSKLPIAGSVLFTFLVAAVIGGWLALTVTFAGLLMALAVGVLARRRLGGATGDVYGASVELSLAVALISVVALKDAGEKLEPIWAA